MSKRCLPLLAILFGVSSGASGQVQASFDDGLISIDCQNAPLSSVFEKIEAVAGVELILEDAIKNTRLTANLHEVPVAMAVQRLLEGSGVNYAVMMDPRDWGRVDKVFVGAGGGGPARSAPPTRQPPPPQPTEENYDEYESYDELDNLDDMNEDFVDDPDAAPDPGANPAEMPPPGSSPVPSYLPPQQSFPRSNFTPGLPGQTPPANTNPQQQQQQQQQGQTPPPPATMPFMDALGRPIPVPPEMYEQQQQQQRRRQQQQEQQEP